MADPSAPLWRQAFDAVERRVTPHAEEFVRTETFAVGAALARRAVTAARGGVRGVTTGFWHLVDLPAGTDVSRLRAQVGALDREVRRLGLQLEAERLGSRPPGPGRPTTPEETDADSAQAPRPERADGARPRPPRRRTQRPARP